MLSLINSSNLMGIDSFIVKVEVDINNGIPCFRIVGLPSTEIKESRERVKSAILNSGYKFPNSRIVVNLSPADLKKEGVFLDLAICIGILKRDIGVEDKTFKESLFIGEISLDGSVKRVRGILPMLIGLKDSGFKRVFIPYENKNETYFVEGIEVISIKNLNDCIDIMKELDKEDTDIYTNKVKRKVSRKIKIVSSEYEEDFSDIKGNYFLKRCSEICAAGNHNMLMIGPPGSGKTMLAKRIRTILPDLSKEEMIEVSKIYSILDLIDSEKGIVDQRPFRFPHHTSTKVSLVGGGVGASPGEVTLAHRGVLFLDELAEFNRSTLETLRQPIEDGVVHISRIKNNTTYPCNMLLIAAMNPCPCGFYKSENECRCNKFEIDKYHSKISGPLLDRFDIFTEVSPVSFEDFQNNRECEKSKDIKKRVENARKIQKRRFNKSSVITNSEIKSSKINEYCKVDKEGEDILRNIFNKYKLSNRSYVKLLKISRTIADLEEREVISSENILEAFSYRKAYYNYFR